MELDSALLAVLGDVEARRHPHQRPVRELDQRDPESGAPTANGSPDVVRRSGYTTCP